MGHAETVESIVSLVGAVGLTVAMLVFIVSISFARPQGGAGEQPFHQAVAAAARRAERWAARTALWLGLLLLSLYFSLAETTDWVSWRTLVTPAAAVVISAGSVVSLIRERRRKREGAAS